MSNAYEGALTCLANNVRIRYFPGRATDDNLSLGSFFSDSLSLDPTTDPDYTSNAQGSA